METEILHSQSQYTFWQNFFTVTEV